MTDAPSGREGFPAGATVKIVISAVGLVLGAIGGAYLHWVWWDIGSSPLTTILGVAILTVGLVVALIPREMGRRIGLLILAVGVGLLVGQNLGPSREPLIYQFGGTMTLSLTSPSVDVATGSADCTNVSSETETSVQGTLDPSPGSPSWVLLQIGDRFSSPPNNARIDQVRFQIYVITELDPGGIKVAKSIGMEATESSSLESAFGNGGGSIRFADLEALAGDGSGESIDLAGTLTWTCGAAKTP